MSEQSLLFDGNVAIVTGAGRGIGRAIALELGRRGARVVVNDVAGADGTAVGSSAEAVADEIKASGGIAMTRCADIADPRQGQGVIDAAIDAWGRVDVVVPNAGIVRNALVDEMTIEQWDAVMNVNLRGAFNIAQPAYRRMKQQGSGHIVFIASFAGLCGGFAQANYAASKAALFGLTRSLAAEGRESGIAVNAVCPSAGDTHMATSMTHTDPAVARRPASLGVDVDPGFPVDRLTADRVAPLVVALLHPTSLVSGEIFGAHGGLFHRFWTEYGDGWLSDSDTPDAEQVLAHFNQIRDGGEAHEIVDEVQQWSVKFLSRRFALGV